MKKLLALTAVAALVAGNAQAATTVSLGATSSDISYIAGGQLAANIDLSTLSSSQLVLTGDAMVVNPASSLSGQYAQPTGTLFGNNYLAVLANPSPAGSATYNVAPSQAHNFGFTWGTIDAYNTLVITATNATYTITGTDIANNIGGGTGGTGQEDVLFTDNVGSILSATFTSSSNSFEVANFGSAVPLPAALPLLGSALVGAGALARRRKA